MYQAHWGLQESPFRGNLDPKSFYQSPTHEEALARLNFLVDQRRRLGLLVGPSGSGKSLLLEVFAQQLRHSAKKGAGTFSYPQVARLSLLDVEPTEMLWLLAAQWGLNPQPSPSAAALWQAIDDRLFEYRCQQLDAVVLFDDIDQADRQALQHVTRLARFDPSPEMRLTIVLAGRNEGMARLSNSLLDLAELRIDVEPWERGDTEDFVNALLSQAGRRSPVFAPRAVDRLHELAHGIPRRVSQLADLALLAGAGQNLDHIDAGVVETVYQELGSGV
jgi:type II secretory pathway predicted ATPase ExeA